MEKMKARARKSLYWPGMTKDIEDIVFKCPECRKYAYKQVKEPMIKRHTNVTLAIYLL
jgi:hypothetical protein